ncbi:MAG: PhzF family phenazine biosynthesis protein [Actinomycetota bacterium]|nr:PhzF family phenazine biosynthesis protein [Actinomycetota bacterium]
MATLHILRVFCDAEGRHGNPLGVFLDGAEVPAERRQAIARDLGFSETVFVDDPETGAMRIFAPELEFQFAGHPSVGTAWLLARERQAVVVLHPPAGAVGVRVEDDLTWISARPEWAPRFDYVQYGSPAEVDSLPARGAFKYAWAWQDDSAGLIRARSFVAEAGIGEDEATGAAALALAALIERPVTIRQGTGSELYARPLPDGRAEVGGRVVLEGTRPYAV